MSVVTSTPASFASVLAGPGLLRWSLGLDALACAAFAAPMTLAPGLLSELLGLPAGLLLWAGSFLWIWTAFLILTMRRRAPSSRAIWVAIIANILRALDAAILWASGWVQPTAFGHVFLAVNVVGVALFALLQFLGLRRTRH